jgi:hypothetical protein
VVPVPPFSKDRFRHGKIRIPAWDDPSRALVRVDVGKDAASRGSREPLKIWMLDRSATRLA